MSTADFLSRPYFVYEFETSYVELSKSQFWEGYCILFSKFDYHHLTDMPSNLREKYLMEMSILGEAMMEVLEATRINYNILGNSHPIVHAHLFPRYDWEDEELRKTVVWKYDQSFFSDEVYRFNEKKHAPLKEQLAQSIDRRYKAYLQGDVANV